MVEIIEFGFSTKNLVSLISTVAFNSGHTLKYRLFKLRIADKNVVCALHVRYANYDDKHPHRGN